MLGYRQQFKLEKKFSDMKSTDYIQVRPIFTWTDANIQIHIFICLLALLGQALLKLKLKDLKIQRILLNRLPRLRERSQNKPFLWERNE